MNKDYSLTKTKVFTQKQLRKGLLGVVFAGASLFTQAQVSDYQFAQTVGTLVPVSSSATVLGTGSQDSVVYPVNLPFQFFYNGASYNAINVSSNGFVTFGSTAPSTILYKPISAGTGYVGAISAWARDLNGFSDINGVTSNISTEVVGSAPNREMVIQWTNFRPMYSSSSTNVYGFTFQIRLQETTGTIKMVYNKGSYLAGSTEITPSATTQLEIGLRGATTSDFNNRKNSTTELFTNSTAGTANTDSQVFTTLATTPGMPVDGLTYTWTTPTCLSPTGVNVSNITPNSATVSWTASVSAPANGYDLYYSTSPTPPTSTTAPTVSGITGLTANLGTPTALTPSTDYYVWLRSVCSATDSSNWSMVQAFRTLCQPPVLASVTGDTVCLNGSATLAASTSTTGAQVKWYDAATGGNLVGTGNSYTTPILTNTTTYYASALTGTTSSVGVASPAALTNSGTTSASTTFYMEATVSNSTVHVQSVDVFPSAANSASSVKIYLGTSSTPLYTIPFTSTHASGGVTPQTIPLNLDLAPGVYRFKIEGSGSYYRNYSTPGGVGQSFPYTSGNFALTGGSNVTTGYYLFYNFIVGESCESARQPVIATVDTSCLSTTEVAQKDALKVYPNPFVDVVNISNVDEVKSAIIVDAAGRVVKTFAKVNQQLSLVDLKAGMYVLNLEMKDGTKQAVKLIKK